VLHGTRLGRCEREEHADRAVRARHVELAPHPVLRQHRAGVRALADVAFERADLRLPLRRQRVEEEVDRRNLLRLRYVSVVIANIPTPYSGSQAM
jgi:hypothetical protein